MLTYLLLAVSVLLGAAVVELAFAVKALAQAQRLTALVMDAVRGGSDSPTSFEATRTHYAPSVGSPVKALRRRRTAARSGPPLNVVPTGRRHA